MDWNYNIDEARKTIVTVLTRTVKKKGKTREVDIDQHEPFHILAAFEHKSGEVNFTRSYWIPEQGRWNMFSKKEGTTQPFAFIPVDELNAHPNRSET